MQSTYLPPSNLTLSEKQHEFLNLEKETRLKLKKKITSKKGACNLKKLAEELITQNNWTGSLECSDNGFTYLKIGNEFVTRLGRLLKSGGFIMPPFFGPNSVGAHVSVISPTEARQNKLNIENIKLSDEKNIQLKGRIKDFQIVEPPNWQGIKKVALLTLDFPELEKIRANNNLSDKINGKEFHITIGVIKNTDYKSAFTCKPFPKKIIYLSDAIDNNRLDLVQYWMAYGVKLTKRDDQGFTVLHRALKAKNNYEILKFLLNNGAKKIINTTTNLGETPLAIAVESADLNKIKLLVDAGAELTPRYDAETALGILEVSANKLESAEARYYNSDSPLPFTSISSFNSCFPQSSKSIKNRLDEVERRREIHSYLLKSVQAQNPLIALEIVRRGKLEDVKILINNDLKIDFEKLKNSRNFTLLHKAAESESLEMLKYLLKIPQIKNQINYLTNEKYSPLMIAVSSAKLENIKLLVKAGADFSNIVQFCEEAISEEQSFLEDLQQHEALSMPHIKKSSAKIENLKEIKEYLLKKTNQEEESELSSRDERGDWPIKSNFLNVLSNDEFQKSETPKKRIFGSTPLHEAIKEGNFESVKKILECTKRDLNVKSIIRQMALLMAVESHFPNLEIVRHLVESGADLSVKYGYKQIGILELSKIKRDEAYSDLKERPTSREYFRSNDGFDNGCYNEYKTRDDIYRYLLNKINSERPSLQECIRQNRLDDVKTLIANGAPVKMSDPSTLLHLAAGIDNSEMLKCLLETPAKELIDQLSYDDSSQKILTPLGVAIQQGHLDNVRLLVNAGADLHIVKFPKVFDHVKMGKQICSDINRKLLDTKEVQERKELESELARRMQIQEYLEDKVLSNASFG